MAKVSGGDRYKAALGKIVEHLKVDENAGGNTLWVGFLEGATYPDGKSVGFVAAMNEYGHGIGKTPEEGQPDTRARVPPRPFFRNMIAAKKGEWPAAITNLLKKSDYNARDTLLKTGEAIAGQLRQSIVDFTTPANAPSTITKKGFSKPLVDTGHMLNSVDYDIVGR